MGQSFEQLSDRHREFAENSPMFFVATAADGRVNLSPKGIDSIRFLSPNSCVWFNYNGSGNQTASHAMRNSRMTLLFTSFAERPLNLRLFGYARILHKGELGWDEHYARFDNLRGIRQIFLFNFDLVTTACGLSTPHMEIIADRTQKGLVDKFSNMSDAEIADYQQRRGVDRDHDGLPTDIGFDGG